MAIPDYDPTQLAGRPSNEKGKAARLAIEREDVRWLLDGPRGRRIVWALLVQGGMGQPMFVPGVTRESDLVFAAGQRDTAEQLLDLIRRHAADLYPELVAEQFRLDRATGTNPKDADHGTLAEHAAR